MDLSDDDMGIIPGLPPIYYDNLARDYKISSSERQNELLTLSPKTEASLQTSNHHDVHGSSISSTCKKAYDSSNFTNDNETQQIDGDEAFRGSSLKKKAESSMSRNMTSDYKNDDSFKPFFVPKTAERGANGEWGKKVDEQVSFKFENEIESEKESAAENNDDESRNSDIKCDTIISNPTVVSPKKRHEHIFRYYAVRVGYAKATCFRENMDDLELERGTFLDKICPMVKIRSAIFLYWDDACQFLEDIDNLDQSSSLDFKVEYDGFDSVAEAEAYLLEPETRLALKHVAIIGKEFQKERSMSSDAERTIDQAKGCVLKFQLFNPIPSYLIPSSTGACEVDFESTAVKISKNKNLNEQALPKSYVSKKDLIDKLKPSRAQLKSIRLNKPQQPERVNMTPEEKLERKKANKENRWNFMFNELLKYKNDNNGALDLPDNDKEDGSNEAKPTNPDGLDQHELRKLRTWCEQQRRHHRHWVRCNTSGFFTREKYVKLKDAGFKFLELSWDEQYEKLKAYKDVHNTLKVEKDWDENLYKWSLKQRNTLRRHFEGMSVNLSEERLNKLIDLGWQKDHDSAKGKCNIRDLANEEKRWNKNYQQLKRYKEENGHMWFGRTYVKEEDVHLRYRPISDLTFLIILLEMLFPLTFLFWGDLERRWVAMIRKEYRKLQNGKQSNLTAIQMKSLSEIGFDFNPRKINNNNSNDQRWELNIQLLKEYKERQGDFTLRKGEDRKMIRMIKRIRLDYKKKKRGDRSGLTDERIVKLEEIGFDFQRKEAPYKVRDVVRSWEERFQQLLQFKEEHGHCLVPQISGGILGEWVRRQRCEYKKLMAGERTALTHEKALRLSSIGFCFDASSRFKGTIRTVQS